MAKQSFNALQAILIRERLILYWKVRKSAARSYSVRKLIEDIALSDANEGAPDAYDERRDQGDGRFDAGFTLKHSTVDNLISRKASAISDDNLALIGNFLAAEGFLSAEALALCGRHPDSGLRVHFKGLASSDPRLQRYRRVVEGEFCDVDPTAHHNLWIAAPGRSQPFVALRASYPHSDAREAALRPATKYASPPWTNEPELRYEGRIFLMPNQSMTLVEMCVREKTWDGNIYRVAVRGNEIALLNNLGQPQYFCRLEIDRADGHGDEIFDIRDISLAGAGRPPGLNGDPGWPYEDRDYQYASIYLHPRSDPLGMALVAAAKDGTAGDVLGLLLSGANINSVDPETGRTAAHWAAAVCSLEKVSILDCRIKEEAEVLLRYCPRYSGDAEAIERWRAARATRYRLHTDNEGCFPSALAPVSTDHSIENHVATTIWRRLFESEWQTARHLFGASPGAFLDVWQPSSAMRNTAARRSAILPPGFRDPLKSRRSFLTSLFRIR
ncbi:hypothetical protein [Filomicrobium sp.]|uniref:hypothetical protein n=1 Tax=Filomicrobium sp. TaxID=2024831 RepID=UPI00258E38DD|nr:hypothetical protein [Filomicrobium sp.]MCV0370223.1 ankyrin repeat domain-containing protein [Filomicrobium sp.]